MNKNYLFEKLQTKSKANLVKEINSKVADLDYVDGCSVYLSLNAIKSIKGICISYRTIRPNSIISIILKDIVDTRLPYRLNQDIDKFFTDIEEMKSKLDTLE